ncbi:MAG: LytTR family transcriptional regulator DNA-binding domain-containing protein [Paludibacteraceae bacterium]
MTEKLLIHTSTEAYSFQPAQITCIEADGNYCNLHLANGNIYLLTFQLGYIEAMIKEQLAYTNHSFVRVGKSLIINMDELLCINLPRQTLEMNSPSASDKYVFKASKEALKKLMNLMIEHRNSSMIRNINAVVKVTSGNRVLRGHRQQSITDTDIRVICD